MMYTHYYIGCYMKILYENPTLSVENIGSFTVNSGEILFTDPCYTVGTWCQGHLKAINGIYNVCVGTFKSDYDNKNQQKNLLAIECAIDLLNQNIDFDDLKNVALSISGNKSKIDTIYKNTNKKYHYLIEKYLYKLDPFTYESSMCRFIYNIFNHACINEFIDYDFWDDYWKEFKSINQYKDKSYKDEIVGLRLKYLNIMITEIKNLYATTRYNRNQYIHISTGEFTDHNDEGWSKSTINIGVDSGQAGMFDREWYNSYNGGHSDEEEDDSYWEDTKIDGNGHIILQINDNNEHMPKTAKITYQKICELSDREYYDDDENIYYKVAAGVFEFGCNSSTAYGDGGYSLYVRLNENEQVVEAVINFDGTGEDE